MRTALLLALIVTARAAEMTDWKHVQILNVPQAGLHTVALPAVTLDAARSGLEDLRLLSPAGIETPYLVERPVPAAPIVRAAKKFDVTLTGNATVLAIETGFDQPLQAVTLDTRAGNFIKAVLVEGSANGQAWQVIATGRPVFRQPNGASQLTIALPAAKWTFLRLTVDDTRAEPVPFTGATLHAASAAATPAEPVGVAITERAENDGQTRLTLDLGVAHLTLATLQFECADPLFMRRVNIAVREVTEAGITERVLLGGTIYRVAVEGQPAAAELSLPVERLLPHRELLVIIENQDNPPLNVTAVRATRRPCWLSFHAAQPGNWQVYTGNPFAAAPRYDLAGLGGRMKTESVRDFQPGALAANPAYRPREVLPDIEKLGSPLDVANWRYRKLVTIARAGVQQLELDLETLARADQQCRDLRLLRDGQQRPYVLERTSRQQKIAVEASQANDPKRPTVSRWQMKLPHSRLPLTKLVCASPTGLFQRDLQLYERPTDERGEPFQRDLGHASWTRTPGSAVRTLEIALSATPLTDTVFLETDNRDNPPIELEKFAVYVPITRIWFKAPAEPATLLYFGNTAISAPQYDIALVAPQLLAAERHRPALGPVEQLKPTGWAERPETARSRNLIFWAALAVVVVVLLALVIKFLPKEPPPQAK